MYARTGTRTRTLISWLLVAIGVCLLFLGGREWFESLSGQKEAERDFEQPVPASFPREVAGHGKNLPRRTPASGESFARLSIPRLDAQLYVFEGIGSRQLRRGPAHMTGSALPGEDGNCIIAGHRDTHFRVLEGIQKGDDIRVRTGDGEHVYRVNQISIVSENNTSALRDTSDGRLHLITCYPFHYVGNAPRRFIVEARLVN